MVVTNINLLDDIYKKALAYFALFQSCIIKRPFNLFHRKNLYLRFAEVKRDFGNKATWDTPFEVHFRKFIDEANQAVFSNNQQNRALNLDVFDIEGEFDLVYIDTPYISKTGVGVDYFSFYHFLEGLVNYPKWGEMIDYRTKHKKLKETVLFGLTRTGFIRHLTDYSRNSKTALWLSLIGQTESHLLKSLRKC